MIIAINGRTLTSPKLEGIGQYTLQLITRMIRNHPQDEFHILLDRRAPRTLHLGANAHLHIVYPPTRHPWLWKIWFEYRVPALLKKVKADVFFSPDGFLSMRTSVPTVLTLHDLAYHHQKEWMKDREFNFYHEHVPQFLQKAIRIITVSDSIEKEISAVFSDSKDKVITIYNGVDERFRPVADKERKATQTTFAGGCEYFIYVGSIHPRKNILRLIQAFDHFVQQSSSQTKLLLVGRLAWRHADVLSAIRQVTVKESIHLLHNIEDEIFQLVASAKALVYPSLYEGFGLPILEAFSSGTPVICSHRAAMAEIAGESALLIDPLDKNGIVEALTEIDTNLALREKLAEHGKSRARDFSWDKSAQLIYSVLRESV